MTFTALLYMVHNRLSSWSLGLLPDFLHWSAFIFIFRAQSFGYSWKSKLAHCCNCIIINIWTLMGCSHHWQGQNKTVLSCLCRQCEQALRILLEGCWHCVHWKMNAWKSAIKWFLIVAVVVTVSAPCTATKIPSHVHVLWAYNTSNDAEVSYFIVRKKHAIAYTV